MDEVKDERTVPGTPGFMPAGGMPAGDSPAGGKNPVITEDVIFLEPGQEKAQNIVKAISHQNAGEVMQLLSLSGPLRLSDIADKLGLSLNAAKYHIENLMNAGLLDVDNTRYSVKGRKIKIYRLKNQVFIVAPRMTGIAEVRSALLKYGAALGMFIFVFFLALIQPFVELPPVPIQLLMSTRPVPGLETPVAADSGVVPALIIAAAVTLVLLACIELYERRKNMQQSA